jgi:phosphoadenosine phosphosulfate reductase
VENRLPRHPLVARGFPSIGCAPCTSAVKPGEDPRAGRWRNSEKTECGIHFINGKAVRIPKESAA